MSAAAPSPTCPHGTCNMGSITPQKTTLCRCLYALCHTMYRMAHNLQDGPPPTWGHLHAHAHAHAHAHVSPHHARVTCACVDRRVPCSMNRHGWLLLWFQAAAHIRATTSIALNPCLTATTDSEGANVYTMGLNVCTIPLAFDLQSAFALCSTVCVPHVMMHQ